MKELIDAPPIRDIPVNGGITHPEHREKAKAMVHGSRSLSDLFRHRRGLILSLSLIAMLGSIVHSLTDPPLFSSSVLLYINEPIAAPTSPNGGTAVQEPAGGSGQDHWSSVFHDVRSTEMSTFLIDRFNLIEHYGLDTGDPMAMNEALHLISENIEVHRAEESGMEIIVEDRDRSKAADMANAMHDQLVEMSQVRMQRGLSQANGNYTKAIEGTSRRGRQVVNDLIAVSKELHSQYPTASVRGEEGPFAPVDVKIQEMATELSMINAELLRNTRSMEIALAVIKDPDASTIRSVRRAQRDMFTSPGMAMMMHAVFWSLSSAVLLLLLLIIWELKGRDIRAAFTTPLSELMDP
jgi:hypothetical protein